ncbi:MAG: hypothetical protein M3Q58_01380 [Bacteroidota bacterium]|nr:hypothetical protein [Bacteroidota bacterium]
MANLVKTKRRIIVLSILVSVLIPALSSNFFKTPVIKKWSNENLLTWEDFNGIPRLFTIYGAAINSKLYLEYDSLKGSYYAYAGQNNNRSWALKSMKTSEYGLRHEQYHFNITEIFCRRFNKFILDIPNASLSFLEKTLGNVHQSLSEMQDQYDDETDHSLNTDYQRYWEYKVDSLLTDFDKDKGIRTDYFSGISAKFSYPPDTVLNHDKFLLRSGYWLEKYSMRFRYLSTYDVEQDTTTMEKDFVSFLESLPSFTNVSSKTANYNGMFLVQTECEDTVSNNVFHDWIYYKFPYEYQITVCFPLDDRDNVLYNEMKNTFINSINIANREAYWIAFFKNNKKELIDKTVPASEKNSKDSAFARIFFPHYTNYAVFYHNPFAYKNHLLIPFGISKHAFEEIDDIVIHLNNKSIFTQRPDSVNQIIGIDLSLLEPGNNFIQFGYTIKSDSLTSHYQFYGSSAEYEFIKK